jgi:hypothetical protein
LLRIERYTTSVDKTYFNSTKELAVNELTLIFGDASQCGCDISIEPIHHYFLLGDRFIMGAAHGKNASVGERVRSGHNARKTGLCKGWASTGAGPRSGPGP